MQKGRQIAVIVTSRQEEAFRMAVGYTVLGDKVDVYLLDTPFQVNKALAQSLEALFAMGGKVFCNGNMESPIIHIEIPEAAKRLLSYDTVVTY